MWHCKTGHFLGFFGQTNAWTLNDEILIPPSPVQPSDITEVRSNIIFFLDHCVIFAFCGYRKNEDLFEILLQLFLFVYYRNPLLNTLIGTMVFLSLRLSCDPVTTLRWFVDVRCEVVLFYVQRTWSQRRDDVA